MSSLPAFVFISSIIEQLSLRLSPNIMLVKYSNRCINQAFGMEFSMWLIYVAVLYTRSI